MKNIDIFKDYTYESWLQLIEDVLNFVSLRLPELIDQDGPSRAFKKINECLEINNAKQELQLFNDAIVHSYVNLKLKSHNFNNFVALHTTIASIKPQSFDHFMIRRFTSEAFLNTPGLENGVELQTSLLSALSSLSIVNSEQIVAYLSANYKSCLDPNFIKISLRYFLKSRPIVQYFNYLNKLLDSIELSYLQIKKIAESIKECYYQFNTYSQIYDWLSHFNVDSEQVNCNYLMNELKLWVTYKNPDIKKEAYGLFLFLKLHFHEVLPVQFFIDLSPYMLDIKESFAMLWTYFIQASINNQTYIFDQEKDISIYRIDLSQSPYYFSLELNEEAKTMFREKFSNLGFELTDNLFEQKISSDIANYLAISIPGTHWVKESRNSGRIIFMKSIA